MHGFREIKHHYNKPTETYGCEVLDWAPQRVVLKYVNDRAFYNAALDLEFPVGTTTIATYWANRGYVVWQMFDPADKLLGYYVHIIEDMTIVRDAVEYRDAVLDIWFWPNGNHQVLDEAELNECLRRGQISRERGRVIQEHRAHVLMTWERIVQQLPVTSA